MPGDLSIPTAMFTADELAVIRRAYAHQVVATAATTNPRIEAAFATVPREKFLGAPPWQIANLGGGYRPLPSSDLVLAYQDVLFALQTDKGVHNGSPSLHARLLAELDIQIGDRIAHIGAGTGYYSAILSELVGASGHVYAVEMDPDLAAHAQTALADRANVSVMNADGSQWPQEEVDAIYVNFAVARPAEPWIERLRPGGRLVLPLGVPRQDRPPKGGRHASHGAALRIERGEDGFAARWIGTAYFVCANGGLSIDDNEIEALTAAFRRGGIEFVKSLLWKTEPRIGRCWYIADQWALCYDDV
ncbi:protein-L-isoaspartate O-methyltransferase family protein [Rhizobium laguerreae]|uniref:protein-L-isoaspartate O-methyltransferase family protein n=1 Tax=Rhizobium laguerreae TaxID=1076926 RepID=UPI001C90BCD2|nr:rRNA adenine N-6-methyltransferase family protein [Rhizobium laguerreae]MBY3365031.1 methyltransferase domain-containing protein [Rhizobium laguerreae]MBY3384234.1 methyltransferase domain-containing protein [Rhizobium laguerreae]MBY3397895.1 methyltransferase domain-containing protein [Rhizobium laguerreae]MBY3404835.1 methyltransferase domain-containing protein [Rhizobium laguerreae]